MATPSPLTARRWARLGLVAGTAAALAATGVVPAALADEGTDNTSRKLRQAVSAEGIAEHLRALQQIADENGGTRASGTPGYDASAAYAAQVFRDAGYEVSTQEFEYRTFRELSPSVLQETAPGSRDLEHVTMEYSGSGDVTAPASIPEGAATGCDPADFGPSNADTVAVISRGACTFQAKVENAAAAGADAAVIYNNVEGTLNGTLSAEYTGDTPAVGVTQALGEELVGLVPQGLELRVAVDGVREMETTSNVFAESAHGDDDNVVMAGAHLDSVSEGPGINDNGSGSGAILEVAEQMAKVHPKNTVRFALWGAEESGLVGSWEYILDLDANDPEELEDIALYLNFDMVGSPNYARFVYDGDDSDGVGAGPGPEGSAQIEKVFTDYFASQGLASKGTDFSGRSDYQGFIAAGIPAGGLFTGAEGIKTPEEAEMFGGTAGVAYDPCYHQACDTIDNVSMQGLDEMSDAIAHSVITYAMDTRAVNGEGNGHPVAPPGQNVDGDAMTGAGSQGGLHDGHVVVAS